MNKQQLAAKIWESANQMRSKIEANEYAPFKRAQKSLLWTVIALCIITQLSHIKPSSFLV